MMERALLTPDELKSIPKGSFIVMKAGTHPMRTQLRLFLQWGITFGAPYTVPERANREVACANRVDLDCNLPPAVHGSRPRGRNRTSNGIKTFGDDEQ